jgi:hypothetical protein
MLRRCKFYFYACLCCQIVGDGITKGVQVLYSVLDLQVAVLKVAEARRQDYSF